MKETLGFIGVGIMGKPMAKNLINAGYGLVASIFYVSYVSVGNS